MTGWPKPGSKEHDSLMRDCLNCAMLLGATFEQGDLGWNISDYKIAVGYHTSQHEAARRWLEHQGYNMAYDCKEDTWSPVRI
jgi:hypothetical protein